MHFLVLKEVYSKHNDNQLPTEKKITLKSAFEILRPKSAFGQRRCQNRQVFLDWVRE